MGKDFEEFGSELDALRQEIKAKANKLDTALVAAWVDRLVIMLKEMSESMTLLQESADVLSSGPAEKSDRPRRK